MVKVSQLKYERPDKEEVIKSLKKFKHDFDSASSVEEFLKVHQRYKQFCLDLYTNISLAEIRFTQDTRDEFFAKEKDHLDEIVPEITVYSAEIAKCYLNGKFRAELEKVFPLVMFKNLQLQADSNSPLIVEDKVEQNKLVTAYTNLMSNVVVDFNGEKLPLSGLAKYYSSPDREIRKQAYVKLGEVLVENGAQLDEIYDKLVEIRTRMGRKMGFDNFSPLGYMMMQRNCYDKQDIAKFRANVKKYIVPLTVKIRNKVAEKMGWDKQYLYDFNVFTEEEPKPYGSAEEIFRKASEMYNEMSPETGKIFDMMVDSECFDYMSREGKWGGGYCTTLPKYRLPFILSNFNGSAGDIDVLTHEFGHAFEAYKEFDIDSSFLSSISMETAEVHSMSMEFLAYPWLDKFFKDKTEAYKFYHIGSAVTFIPYGTIVDYFQQNCYDNPGMTPSQRNEMFNMMEKEFIPYMSTEGLPGIEKGRRWQRQAHIYESPFYYIDYCLAQFTALQFLALSQQDYKSTFDKYVKFVSLGCTKSFVELLKDCDLYSPFEEQSFKIVVKAVEKILSL